MEGVEGRIDYLNVWAHVQRAYDCAFYFEVISVCEDIFTDLLHQLFKETHIENTNMIIGRRSDLRFENMLGSSINQCGLFLVKQIHPEYEALYSALTEWEARRTVVMRSAALFVPSSNVQIINLAGDLAKRTALDGIRLAKNLARHVYPVW